MLKENQRPIYLDIKAIKFPITAIASILHRISGLFLFLMIGPLLWILKLSLSSEDNFFWINCILMENSYIFQFLTWIGIVILGYHIFFGIRQILMDFGYLRQTLLIGRISVSIVFVLIVCLSIYLGIYIWYPLN